MAGICLVWGWYALRVLLGVNEYMYMYLLKWQFLVDYSVPTRPYKQFFSFSAVYFLF